MNLFFYTLGYSLKKLSKNHARFIWRNLTKDGGAILSGGLELEGFIDGTSNHLLDFYQDGY